MRERSEIDVPLRGPSAGPGQEDRVKVSRTSARLAVVAGTAAAALLLASTPAWAVEQTLKIGNIKLGHGGVIRSGYKLYACDDRADGTGVRTEVQLSNGYSDSVGDGNGSQAGCGEKLTPGQSYAVQYRVCWGAGSTCTGWARAY
jgi:hypothetical protein